MVRAYQEAYETGNLRKAGILKKASDLLDHPFIQRRFSDLTGGFGSKAYNHLMERLVLEGLKNEALDPKNPPNVRVRALETLGKTNSIGLFSDTAPVSTDSKLSGDELEQLLLEKLAKLADSDGVSH
jgi:hypothetical protein